MPEGFSFIGLFMIIFIIVLVGTSLVGPLAQSVGTAADSEGISGTPSDTLISLSTLFFIIFIVITVAALVILGMRLIGM